MTAPPVPLEDLAQRIARQQAELETLRRDYEARQARLADLTRQKEDLQAQLRAVEADIQAVAQGSTPRPTGGRGKAAALKLPNLLVDLVREAGQPITVKQLAQELVRRKFPTRSGDVQRLVQARVYELVQKGILKRSADRRSVTLGATANGAPAAASGPRTPARKGPSRPAKAARRAPRARHIPRGSQPPLRVVLTDVLRQSKEPLSGGELAARVKATGYRTASKDFASVVWVAVQKIDDIEHVPGQGYRLKRPRG